MLGEPHSPTPLHVAGRAGAVCRKLLCLAGLGWAGLAADSLLVYTPHTLQGALGAHPDVSPAVHSFNYCPRSR